MNKFNINHNIYDTTNTNDNYRISFINPIRNIGKNDIYIFIDNKIKNHLSYNKACRRLINFKIFSICLFKYNK